MKILFLQDLMTQTSGVTKIVLNIARELQKSKNIEIFLIVKRNNINEKYLNEIFSKVKILNTVFVFDLIYLIYFVKRNKIDIIHSHHRYFDFLATLLSKIINVKTVMTVHSKVFGRIKLSYKSKRIIVVSNAIKEHLISVFKINPNKITLIPNFITIEDVKITKGKNVLYNELGIDKAKTIVGYIGNMDVREKGIDILLKAFENLDNNDLILLLVGSGRDKKYVKKFIEKRNLKIILLDEIKDVYNYYNIIDIFVLPSRIESFGLVLLEAGIMKLSIIASNVDGIPEIIKNDETGFLFEPGNVNDLICKIRFHLENPNVGQKFAQNFFDRILNNFTSKKIIPQYQQLYNTMMGN